MSTKKKNKLILLLAITFLLASIVVLVVYFCLFRQKTQSSDVFTISCSNLEMVVGQTCRLPIEISFEEADLCYEIEDSKIVVISDGNITALNAGMTKITITASYKSKQATCNFNVTVMRDTLTCNLKENSDCKILDNKIYLTSSSCQFFVELYNKFDEMIINPACEILVSDEKNIKIEKLPFGFLLCAKENGFITFDFYEYDFTISFEVIAL